jgi:hypothetical protein
MKRHIASQFELPVFGREAFNLAGQTVRQDQPQTKPVPREDNTREFPGLRGTFHIHELKDLRP